MRKWVLKLLLLLSMISLLGSKPSVAFARGHSHGGHISFHGGGGGGNSGPSAPASVLGLHGDANDSGNNPVNPKQSIASIANDGIRLVTGEIYYYPGTKAFMDHYYDHDRYLGGLQPQSAINDYYYYQSDAEDNVINADNEPNLFKSTRQMLIDQDIQYQRTNLQPRIFVNFITTQTYNKNIAPADDQGLVGLHYTDEDGDQMTEYEQKNYHGAMLNVYYNHSTNHPTQFKLYLDQGLKQVIPTAKIKALTNANVKQLHSQNIATVNRGIVNLNRGLTELIWQYLLAPNIQHPSGGIDGETGNNGPSSPFDILLPMGFFVLLGGNLLSVVYRRKRAQDQYKFKP